MSITLKDRSKLQGQQNSLMTVNQRSVEERRMGAEITEDEYKCFETMFRRLRSAVGDKETEMYKDRIIGALELILFRDQED